MGRRAGRWRLRQDRAGGKHHVSALCHLAPQLAARLAACWRNGERYIIRDTDGRIIDETEGRKIVAERWKVPADVRRANRTSRKAQHHKKRTDRRRKKSTVKAAPAAGPSTNDRSDTREAAA